MSLEEKGIRDLIKSDIDSIKRYLNDLPNIKKIKERFPAFWQANQSITASRALLHALFKDLPQFTKGKDKDLKFIFRVEKGKGKGKKKEVFHMLLKGNDETGEFDTFIKSDVRDLFDASMANFERSNRVDVKNLKANLEDAEKKHSKLVNEFGLLKRTQSTNDYDLKDFSDLLGEKKHELLKLEKHVLENNIDVADPDNEDIADKLEGLTADVEALEVEVSRYKRTKEGLDKYEAKNIKETKTEESKITNFSKKIPKIEKEIIEYEAYDLKNRKEDRIRNPIRNVRKNVKDGKLTDETEAYDEYKMALPEGREYFDSVFQKENKKITQCSPEALRKDLTTKAESLGHFSTLSNAIDKVYNKNERFNTSHGLKMVQYLDKIGNKNGGLHNSLIKSYEKLLSRY